jgi:hypothetical protein
MNNTRITTKERNLLKGAMRRVFSRSELRQLAVATTKINHTDITRPRVKKWSMCPVCTQYTPTYLIEVDHSDPIVPLDKSLEDMSWDEVINRIWCELDNLKPICKSCHLQKTRVEGKIRRENRKKRKGIK